MQSQAPEKCLRRPMPGLIAKPGEIVVPVDIFLYISAFLTFTNYQSLIRAFWPDGDEDEVIQKKLWKMSCHKLEATFFNGKKLTIEYNFDAKREGRHRVLIKVDCLLPIFGEVAPAGLEEFASILELDKFIEDNVNLETCSSYRHVCCPCHLGLTREEFPKMFMELALSECEEDHFHHYCLDHVISWLGNYLYTLILLRESKELFDEEIAEQYAFFPSRIPYFQSGSRATSPYLLESALNIDTVWGGMAYYDEDGRLIDDKW
ncbi:repeat element protein-d10.3 [Ichnoviriform fugitivi]|uniref:Repeat element protein-d10.3 n=1 Tax=Ichnoviriform fugitivi TaxID=265522 RepID=A2Q0M7_9VIRU|nr:repeat element protein-d10.3 [Ichnoviriform fugitivi]BAF45742.1 repeat element protein-d10.3 [Ichnoviriform fugitivi]